MNELEQAQRKARIMELALEEFIFQFDYKGIESWRKKMKERMIEIATKQLESEGKSE